MARPAPPTDTIRIAVDGTVFTHAWTNVFWVRVATDGTRTINDLAALLDLIAARYLADFAPTLGVEWAVNRVDGVWQTGPTTSLADSRAHAFNGGSGGSVHDAACSAVVSWKIAARYRGGKPRTYLAGMDTTRVVNGSDLNAAALAVLAPGAVSFMAAINAFTAAHITSAELGTVSFFTAGGSETLPPTYRTPPVFEPYVGSAIRNKIGSQRRRILA